MIGKVVFTIAGIVCILLGLLSVLIIVGMFQHPGGMGTEKIAGPLIGLVAFVLFSGGGLCLYVASRLDNRHKNQQP